MMAYFEVLWNYMLISAPYLLLGLFISGIINQLVPVSKVKTWLGGNNLSGVFKASAVGVPLPLCSCSVIPTAVTLRKNGASNGATSAFLISTPESGIDSISITYGLMDLPMTIIRPIAAFTSAFVAGILQFFFNDFEYKEEVEQEAPKACCSKKSQAAPKQSVLDQVKGIFKFGFGKLSDDIAGWLTVGIFLGALIDFVVPADFFVNLGETASRAMILLIGIPLYICASASTPIAVSLILKGLSPGSALLMLLVGPATNISNIAVLQKYIGTKGVVINVLSIAGVALGFSYLVDYLYAHFFELKLHEMLHQHEHSGAWWEIVSAVLLTALLAKGIYKENIKPKLSKKASSCH